MVMATGRTAVAEPAFTSSSPNSHNLPSNTLVQRRRPQSPDGVDPSPSQALLTADHSGPIDETDSKIEDEFDQAYASLRDRNLRLTLMDEVVLLGLKDQQGYLSFLNDSISYVLRGCILMELALRGKIRAIKDIRRGKEKAFAERIVEVIDGTLTDEVLLDETIRLMKTDKQSIATWMDLLSGETWNPMKVGYQLKQVRERTAKGLVDKGVLRTEKHSFLFFDMATHPLANTEVKEAVLRKVLDSCLGKGPRPTLRTIAMVAAANAANVLENAVNQLPGYSDRDAAFGKAEDFLRSYSNPPTKRISAAAEVIAGVLTVFGRLDNLLY